jgi:hypothetical protein
MRCLLLWAVLGGLMPAGLAQIGTSSGLTLATVKLPPAVRSGIEHVALGYLPAGERRAEAARTHIDRLKLGPGNHWVWEVVSGTCGANNCVYWLFDPATGASLVDDAEGMELDVLDTRHHGWRDFTVGGSNSACDLFTVIYQFDGHSYQLVRTIKDKSPCDQ